LRRAWRAFDRTRFERMAITGLERLELKARVQHVAAALEAVLPESFAKATDVLERSLAPARLDTDLSALEPGPDGLAGWVVWPMTEFVARRGLGEPRRALQALHAMTQRNSAEFAIRPFLLEHPDLAWKTLRSWVADPSAHVRRLVSEGSRPRLPWGMQLKPLIADPSPTLPLLAALQDDPSEYVRRSVANHWNDISKDHPRLVAEWLERHVADASVQLRALLKRATRTLVKRGDPRVLRAWGLGRALAGRATLSIRPPRVRAGGHVVLIATLRSTVQRSQRLVVDYAVRHGKRGGAMGKIWKGWSLELQPAEQRVLERRHSLRPVTTRIDHPGRHRVDLRVNGQVVASSSFVLL
jgi:3-methyladenine DNA glycosylase AlkC